MTYDGDPDSVWSAEGKDVWVCYDLGGLRALDSVQIMWNKGDVRQAKYEILVSPTAKPFTSVFDGLSSGKAANEFETTKMPAETGTKCTVCQNIVQGQYRRGNRGQLERN